MKGQATFPTIIIGVATIIFAVLLVYSIISLVYQDSSEERKNLTSTEDLTLDDSPLWSYVQQLNSNSDCPYSEGPDVDNDGTFDMCDNCPDNFNPEQEDLDNDGIGDACKRLSRGSGGNNGDNDEEIKCFDNADCGTDGLTGNPFCSSDNVAKNYISYICEDAGTEESSCSQNITIQTIETCLFGCQNSTCISPPANITCSFDSQCGTDGFIGNRFCSLDDVKQSYKDFTCNNPDTQNSSCSYNITNRTLETCEDTCANGACIEFECNTNADCNDNNSSTNDTCHHPGTLQSFCTNNHFNITCSQDSDCGANGFVDDPFCLGLSIFGTFKTWDCKNPGTPQSYCTFSEEENLIETCEDVCVGGECQSVFCHSDSDCGADSFIGNPFCLGNSIYRMFEDFMCVFPGLPGSYCASEATQQRVNNCDYACLSGECIRCNENSDCSDSNQSTEDVCIFSGTPFSYCENNPIPSCQDECTLGQRECSGNGYKLCANFDADSCSEWSLPTSCLPTETCTGGFCVPDEPSCQNECIAGQRRCNGNGYQLCANFDADSCSEWSLPTSCLPTQICTNGYCID